MKLTKLCILLIAGLIVVSAVPRTRRHHKEDGSGHESRAKRHHENKMDHADSRAKRHHGEKMDHHDDMGDKVKDFVGHIMDNILGEKDGEAHHGAPKCRPPPIVAPGCTPPMGMPEYQKRVINNGIMDADDRTDYMKEDLLAYLNENSAMTECDGKFLDDVSDIKIRGPQITMKVTCDNDGKEYYATLKVKTHEPNILEEKPTINYMKDTEMILPGSYAGACELGNFHNYFIAFAKEANPDAEECKIQPQYCLAKHSVRNGMYFCPVDCDGTVTNMELVPLEEKTMELVEVKEVPSSKCMKKVTKEHLTEMVMNSTKNTFVFLKDHCNFEGGKEAIKVGDGAFVDLKTGTQYCINVYTGEKDDPKQSTVLAIYQFAMGGTEPIMVAHPFPGKQGMMYCEHFMMTVVGIWKNAA